MIFEICAVVATLVFIILAYVLIKTLHTSQHSLKNINNLALHADHKLKQLDSTFKTLDLFGAVAQEKVKHVLAEDVIHKAYHREPRKLKYDDELTDLFLLVLKLAVKYIRRN